MNILKKIFPKYRSKKELLSEINKLNNRIEFLSRKPNFEFKQNNFDIVTLKAKIGIEDLLAWKHYSVKEMVSKKLLEELAEYVTITQSPDVEIPPYADAPYIGEIKVLKERR